MPDLASEFVARHEEVQRLTALRRQAAADRTRIAKALAAQGWKPKDFQTASGLSRNGVVKVLAG